MGVDLLSLFLLLQLEGAGVVFFGKMIVLLHVWGMLVAAIHMPLHMYSVV